MSELRNYDFTSENERMAACNEYSKLRQNFLSSSAQRRMHELNEAAMGAGLRFQMMNETAYMQRSALVSPKYELVSLVEEQDFADAVASIDEMEDGMEQ